MDFLNFYTNLYAFSIKSKNRSLLVNLRKNSFLALNTKLIKVAFDTRRINQGIDFNPRRNLQYYHRSAAFIESKTSDKIKSFLKLKAVLDSVKEDFLNNTNWLDSYARILSQTLDKTLRIEQKDFDFHQPQIDYLEELLYLRYRIKLDDIEQLNNKELRKIILDKDEKLMYESIYAIYDNKSISKNSNSNINNDQFLEKLFGNVRASKENKEVERSVVIKINDKIIEKNIDKD